MATAKYVPVHATGRPDWFKPTQDDGLRLRVKNSLTEQLDEFVPHEGNRVRWYTCGPTVYDVCHMGHARAYLTFDILRRIMSDYLHYDVEYHVNITDVDDKIILRARRNYLVDQYLNTNPAKEDILLRAKSTLTAERLKAETKLENVKQELSDPATPGRRKTELEEQLKVQALKLEKAIADITKLDGMKADEVATSDLAAVCKDALGISLDAERGATVCNNKVFDDHARKFEESFMIDMQRLGVRPPDVLTRVTEYVPKIVEYCEKLVNDGFAYVSNGSIYLDTKEFERRHHTYRKLKPFCGETSKEELEESEGALASGQDSEKRDPTRDFALWKKSKEGTGEPGWDSPWGRGRPGWHIECTVVASDVLGKTIDIHAGGEDLKFPHHDNELAQSEAFHNCSQWVNYFFHAGHLHIKGLKMSKSLKNFVTIEEALQMSTPRRLRLLFLIQPWDGPFTYSDQSLDEAKAKEKRYAEFLGNCKVFERELIRTWLHQPINEPTAAERKFSELINAKKAEAHAAILNNFNTPACLDALGAIIDAFYAYKEDAKDSLAYPICLEAARYVAKMLRVFGVEFEGEGGESGSREEAITPFVDALVAFREEIKSVAQSTAGDVKLALLRACDRLRDETLVDRGVSLQDEGGKALWKLRDPRELRLEQQEAKQKLQQEAEAKKARAMKKLEEDIENFDKILKTGDGTNMFKTAEFSEWDETGFPLKDASGQPIGKSMIKKLAKEREAATGKWERLQAAAEKEFCVGIQEYILAKRSDLEALRRGAPIMEKKKQNSAGEPLKAAGDEYFIVAGDRFPTKVKALASKNFRSVEEFIKFLN